LIVSLCLRDEYDYDNNPASMEGEHMNLLHIDSSPFLFGSVSRELTAEVVSAWCQCHPQGTVTYRDLGSHPPAHLSAEAMNALHNGGLGVVSEAAQQEVAAIERAIDELMRCDALVIGAPMYNHAVSSNLKCWLDQIAQAGRTFRYTAQGPIGLVPDKPVYVVSSRGGIYSLGEAKRQDFQEPYLLSMLAFLGLYDVTVIRAEGVNLSPAIKKRAMAAARGQIGTLFRADKTQLAAVV